MSLQRSANALDVALSALANSPPGSPEAEAHACIEAILAQEGCRGFVAAFGDGDKLTDLIDTIVNG
jgi:hypothetical protein